MMMMDTEMIDAALMPLAQRSGGLRPLLEGFFGFLARRTDLYVEIPDSVENASMGFRKGMAEKMVVEAFRSFPMKKLEAQEKKQKEVQEKMHSGQRKAEAVKEQKTVQEARTQKGMKQEVKVNESGKQIPMAGNGGVTEAYFWQQSLNEVSIHLDLPKGTSAKEVNCEIGISGLKVGLKNGTVLLDGKYPNPEKVKPDDSFWSLEKETSTLLISLEKTRETWWDCILEGEPSIDTTQVDSTRKIEEYDEGTQAQIRKIMFDQRQKAKGLPTSDEIAREEILQKAMNLPGSPFLDGTIDPNTLLSAVPGPAPVEGPKPPP